MNGKKIIGFLFFAILLLFEGCGGQNGSSFTPTDVMREPGSGNTEKFFITDKTGKRWDVTHAFKVYGLEPEKFQFGGGPFAIPPILNPQFIESEDSNYPDPASLFLVIGFEMFGESRAYSLSVMDAFEVANDLFQETPVAVGY